MDISSEQSEQAGHCLINAEVANGVSEQSALIGLDRKRQLSTETLFGAGREVAIVHGTDEYMLRITKQGKLILTK